MPYHNPEGKSEAAIKSIVREETMAKKYRRRRRHELSSNEVQNIVEAYSSKHET